MGYWVYILRSEKDGKRYVGSTSALELRLLDHSEGRVISTRHRRPMTLAHKESFISKAEAEAREKFYKSGKGREYLKSQGL